MPFTGGFIAKLHVFAAAVDAREYWLAIVGVLSAVVAAFFYLRVTVVTYSSDEPDTEHAAAEPDAAAAPGRGIDLASGLVLTATTAIVLLIGVLPGTFVHFAHDATSII